MNQTRSFSDLSSRDVLVRSYILQHSLKMTHPILKTPNIMTHMLQIGTILAEEWTLMDVESAYVCKVETRITKKKAVVDP